MNVKILLKPFKFNNSTTQQAVDLVTNFIISHYLKHLFLIIYLYLSKYIYYNIISNLWSYFLELLINISLTEYNNRYI